MILQLDTFFVGANVENTVQFWLPHLRQDVDKIEKVRRRSTKMIQEILNPSYSQRLKDLQPINLAQGRLREQLIRAFK